MSGGQRFNISAPISVKTVVSESDAAILDGVARKSVHTVLSRIVTHGDTREEAAETLEMLGLTSTAREMRAEGKAKP